MSSTKGTVKGYFEEELGVEHSYTLEGPGLYDLEEKLKIYTQMIEGYMEEYLKI